MADSKVEHARANFGARYTNNGVTYSDFRDVVFSVERWADWCKAWSARALIHETMGRQALEEKKFVSASEHLGSAAACYHFGKYLFVDDLEESYAAGAKAAECYTLALPHFEFPGERMMIPYEGKHLVGVLRFPHNAPARSPVVVMCNGLDSSKEELDSSQITFLKRGMATLIVDGPGQGEGERDFAIRGDYEVVVGIICDWIATRSDLDADRIGIWGISLGGYYAPRAAAYEKRIKACIALGGPYDWGELWDKLTDFAQDCFRVRSKSADNAEAKQKAHTLTLKQAAREITCPIFIVSSGLDKLTPPAGAEHLAREVRGPAELLIIPDGNHVAHNRAYKYRPQTADWMAQQLGVT